MLGKKRKTIIGRGKTNFWGNYVQNKRSYCANLSGYAQKRPVRLCVLYSTGEQRVNMKYRKISQDIYCTLQEILSSELKGDDVN